MIKQLLTFNYENRWLFALKFALVTAPLQFLLFPVMKFLVYIRVDGEVLTPPSCYQFGSDRLIFFLWLASVPIVMVYTLGMWRYKSGLKLVWRDYIVRGLIHITPIVLVNGFVESIFVTSYEDVYMGSSYGNHEFKWANHLIIGTVFGLMGAIFTGIYLDRTSGAIKFKRTMSVILFVWFLFNLVTGGDSEPEEAPDHVALDTDGDGIKDTIAMDTNKDGLIDSVASDTTGDGKIDTVILDSNHDGRADVTLRDHDGDGRPDGMA